MAYNYYDLGIKGGEVKRRLDLLKDIDVENPIATETTVNNAIAPINKSIDTINEKIKDFDNEPIDAGRIIDYTNNN